MYSRLITLVVLMVAASGARANVSLPDVISDGMVLQQKHRVPIWGTAGVNETVTVRFAGQSKKTIASADGKWLVKLDPLSANATPATMTISGKNTIEVAKILVGEVWLVAGQSNMQRLLSETDFGPMRCRNRSRYVTLSITIRDIRISRMKQVCPPRLFGQTIGPDRLTAKNNRCIE